MTSLKVLVLILCSLIVTNAWAIKKSDVGVITTLYTYDDVGGGDVLIPFATGLEECPSGVFISAQKPGYKTLVSFALTAYTTGKDVLFQVYEENLWSGSANKYCEVDAMRLM